MAERFDDFEAFWLYYLAQHRNLACRRLHVVGTTLALLGLGLAATRSPWWLLACPLAGYGPAWYGHFIFEKNRPATFGHVLWSLGADARMYAYTWLGKLDAELARSADAYPADGQRT